MYLISVSVLLWLVLIALGFIILHRGIEESIDFLVVGGGVTLIIALVWGAFAVGKLGESLEIAEYNKSSTNQLTNAESPVK